MSLTLKRGRSLLLQTITGASCSVLILFIFLNSSAHAIVDTNNNSLSDLWEKHFNSGNLFTDLDPLADPDGDGWTNAQEAVAGTHPFDANPPAGILRPDTVHSPETWVDSDSDGILERIPGVIILTWVMTPGKQYTVLCSPDLNAGSWLPFGESFIGNDNEVEIGLPFTQSATTNPDKFFWRVAVEDIDTDGDGLTDTEEHQFGTNPTTSDTDGDGLSDHFEAITGTAPTDADTDDDLKNDADDADPKDSEINWPKTPESRYMWIEQMVTPTDQYGALIQPVAVNSSGQILFPRYTAGEYDSSTDPPKNHLWDSATRHWTDLPPSGSQAIEIEPGLIITADTLAGGFIDINDAGTVSALGSHRAHGEFPVQGGHDIRSQPAMIWEKTGSPPAYSPPMYFIYHHIHPMVPCPDCGSDYRNHCHTELDTSAHAGSPYYWWFWRPPGGRIGIDGTTNLLGNTSTAFDSFNPVWLLRDGATTSSMLTQVRELETEELEYNSTFAGAILDKNHALFVETPINGNSKLLLKDGATVATVASIAPALQSYETDITHAASKKDDNTERLWIAAGNKILLEKRAGGTEAARWHTPPSMGEGAIRLNARGEAITRSRAATPTAPAIPPKLWRNGKYTDLNEVASKPETVTITDAIDLASNGIILATAKEGQVNKTGLLIPIEIRGYATEQSKQVDSFIGTLNNQNVYEAHRVKIADSSENPKFKTETKTKLKIAQWGDYDIFDDNLDFVHEKFKEDLDIFRVRLPDFPIPAGSIEHRIKITTTDKTGSVLDTGAEVDLNIIREDPADPNSPIKFHETAALALVADDADDDDFAVEGKQDGALGDRTYRAVLGGTVKVEWLTAPGNGPKPVIEIPVPAERVVTIQGFLLKGTTNNATVQGWYDCAKKIYSAAGVDLIFKDLIPIDPLPADVDLSDGFNLPNETAGHLQEMRPETIALMDDPRCVVPQDTIPEDTIPVFFVKKLNPDSAKGATNVPSYMVEGEEKYGGAIFINSDHQLKSVLAHELAHALLDAQHAPSTNKLWNDIFSDTREKTNIWWGDISYANGTWSEAGIDAHRRLTDSMRSRIWKSRFAKIPPP